MTIAAPRPGVGRIAAASPIRLFFLVLLDLSLLSLQAAPITLGASAESNPRQWVQP